jgi:quinol monooxygenase YgiN
MIHVIATIQTAPGRRDSLLKLFADLVPKVHAEAGCIQYEPAIDLPGPIQGQPAARPDVVTVVEKWNDPAALQQHLEAAHMVEFRAKVKDLVTGLEIRLLEPA